MSSTLKIQALEHGVIRLFAIDLAAHEVGAFSIKADSSDASRWPLKDALGAEYLDEDFIEVFPLSNLDGLGLAGYLTTGNDVPADQIDQMAHQLSLLKDHVLLVYSSAFGGSAQTLHPKAPLRHIATFFTEDTPVTFEPLPDESAKLGTGDDEIKPAKKRPSDAAMSGRIATYALLFMFVFTGLIIWIGS